jgi:hypothetical protein
LTTSFLNQDGKVVTVVMNVMLIICIGTKAEVAARNPNISLLTSFLYTLFF